MRAWPFYLLMTVAVLGAPLPSAAQQSAPPASAAPQGWPEYADWVRDLDESAARLKAAREEVRALEAETSKAKSRRRPRGEARAEMNAELDKARQALSEAEQTLPALLEAARRDGVPPGILHSYEVLVRS